ncbi:hypothetical protein VP424E501_P0262 [Vibrio phage 424E50-1]|nr:hypothetical protein VP424E501_P0262 [Vibrio phage 424E50-1]
MKSVYDNLVGKAWISPDLFDTLKSEGKLQSELGRFYVYQGYELILDMNLPPRTFKVLNPEIEEAVWSNRMKDLNESVDYLNKLMGKC